MSMFITFTGALDGDDGPFQLASASGWAAFGKWVGATISQPIRELVTKGSMKGTDKLSAALESVANKYPPSGDVQDTLDGLRELIGVGDPDETATVIS